MTRANSKREISEAAKKNLIALYNKLTGEKITKKNLPESFSNLNWVYNNHAKLYKIIQDFGYTIKSEKTSLSALISALQFLKKDYLAEKYIKLRDILQTKIDHDYGENEPTVKHVGNFEQLVAKRNEFTKLKNKSLKDNYKYIITSIYTLVPPLRNEWRRVQFENKKLFEKFKRSIKQQKEHFLFFNKNGELVLALGEYKSHPPIDIALPKTLEDIITDSFTKFPRTWLFSDYKDKNTPLSNPEFVKLIKEIDLGDEKNYRSIYYSYQQRKNPNMTANKKKEIAELMRTSVPMLDKVYRKIEGAVEITGNSSTLNISDLSKIVKDAVDERLKRVIEIPNEYVEEKKDKTEKKEREKPGPKPTYDKTKYSSYASYWQATHQTEAKESSKKYYDKNIVKMRAIRYVYKLNMGKIKKPSDAKVTEYSIKKVGDKWVIE